MQGRVARRQDGGWVTRMRERALTEARSLACTPSPCTCMRLLQLRLRLLKLHDDADGVRLSSCRHLRARTERRGKKPG